MIAKIRLFAFISGARRYISFTDFLAVLFVVFISLYYCFWILNLLMSDVDLDKHQALLSVTTSCSSYNDFSMPFIFVSNSPNVSFTLWVQVKGLSSYTIDRFHVMNYRLYFIHMLICLVFCLIIYVGQLRCWMYGTAIVHPFLDLQISFPSPIWRSCHIHRDSPGVELVANSIVRFKSILNNTCRPFTLAAYLRIQRTLFLLFF